ncbi:MAG: hypothetical protein ACLFN4_03910 [Candidatus Acetothermia bacterium]
MRIQKLPHLINLLFQWWLASDQILFRRFLNHEAMIFSLGVALGINLWGVFVLYLPINFLIPQQTLERTRSYLRNKFPRLKRHLDKINDSITDLEGDRFALLKSKERRERAISDFIEAYRYDYLFIFLLSVFPIPFLGTIMTGGAIFAVETLEIRLGFVVILIAKVIKVFALSSIAYFAYFL